MNLRALFQLRIVYSGELAVNRALGWMKQRAPPIAEEQVVVLEKDDEATLEICVAHRSSESDLDDSTFVHAREVQDALVFAPDMRIVELIQATPELEKPAFSLILDSLPAREQIRLHGYAPGLQDPLWENPQMDDFMGGNVITPDMLVCRFERKRGGSITATFFRALFEERVGEVRVKFEELACGQLPRARALRGRSWSYQAQLAREFAELLEQAEQKIEH